jgi:NAD-dependent deacetylase
MARALWLARAVRGAYDDRFRHGMESQRQDVAKDLAAAAARLRGARRVLAVTGAGVSAESGVPTFRGQDGLWRQFRALDLATPEAFARDPRLIWEWYGWRRGVIAPKVPNAAHRALVALEQRVPEFLLATQNVDGLHAVAGSRRFVELHGSLWRMRCVECGHAAEDRRVPLPELPPRCACGPVLRPDVTWFGEMLPARAVEEAVAAARAAEVALVIGTSSLVYPAAGLPHIAQAAGAFVVEVNTEPTALTVSADVSLRGPAAELVPALVAEAA